MTRQPDAPRHVVATPGDADTVLRRLIRDGWVARDGFALPDPAWDVVSPREPQKSRNDDGGGQGVTA